MWHWVFFDMNGTSRDNIFEYILVTVYCSSYSCKHVSIYAECETTQPDTERERTKKTLFNLAWKLWLMLYWLFRQWVLSMVYFISLPIFIVSQRRKTKKLEKNEKKWHWFLCEFKLFAHVLALLFHTVRTTLYFFSFTRQKRREKLNQTLHGKCLNFVLFEMFSIHPRVLHADLALTAFFLIQNNTELQRTWVVQFCNDQLILVHLSVANAIRTQENTQPQIKQLIR